MTIIDENSNGFIIYTREMYYKGTLRLVYCIDAKGVNCFGGVSEPMKMFINMKAAQRYLATLT